MPAVPTCFLCQQQIAQQTRKTNDGFLAAGPQGTLIIDGFIKTIPYSSRNDLPIFYTAGVPSTGLFSASLASCDKAYEASLLSTSAAYNSTIGSGTEANLSRSQKRLLLKHKLL